MALVLDKLLSSAEEASASLTDQRKSSTTSVTSVMMIDPSEHFRPEHKSPEEYRIYTTNQVGSHWLALVSRC